MGHGRRRNGSRSSARQTTADSIQSWARGNSGSAASNSEERTVRSNAHNHTTTSLSIHRVPTQKSHPIHTVTIPRPKSNASQRTHTPARCLPRSSRSDSLRLRTRRLFVRPPTRRRPTFTFSYFHQFLALFTHNSHKIRLMATRERTRDRFSLIFTIISARNVAKSSGNDRRSTARQHSVSGTSMRFSTTTPDAV